jgi:hypothetical protein
MGIFDCALCETAALLDLPESAIAGFALVVFTPLPAQSTCTLPLQPIQHELYRFACHGSLQNLISMAFCRSFALLSQDPCATEPPATHDGRGDVSSRASA